MKFFKEIALVAATTLVSGLPTQASANSMVELTYQASQLQCGAQSSLLDVKVDVYHKGKLAKADLAVGESFMVPDFDGVELDYKVVENIDSCEVATPSSLLLGQNDTIPNLPGAYQQESIATLVSNLKDFEQLYLVELGTNDNTSLAYDLQDVVFVVNSDPNLSDSNLPDSSFSPIGFAD